MANAQSASFQKREWPSVAGPTRDSGARFDQRIEEQPTKLLIDSPRPSGVEERPVTSDEGSIRRIFRLPLFSLAILIGIGATLGWQSYRDAVTEIIVEQAPTLASLLPASTKKSLVSAATAPEIAQQLMPLTFGLDVMRRSVDQLTAKQEQISQNIAALQAVEEDVRQRVSTTPPPPAQQAVSIQPPKRSQLNARSSALQATSVPRAPSGSGFLSR